MRWLDGFLSGFQPHNNRQDWLVWQFAAFDLRSRLEMVPTRRVELRTY
jgi:hypothetical protein